MKREKLRRTMFVSAACLLSFPWLTPCVGIWSAAAVNGAHDSITKRDEPLARLPNRQLKALAAKPLPKISALEKQAISPLGRITDAELAAANGGRDAPRPGTIVGKGASALVDGMTYTLTWVDPFTWVSRNSLGIEPTKPLRQLILCESPFVVIEGQYIRFTREGNNGPVRLAKATNAKLTVITPEGSYFARAQNIHFRGPSQEVLLENPYTVVTGTQSVERVNPDSLMKLNFLKHQVSCSGAVINRKRGQIDGFLPSGLR